MLSYGPGLKSEYEIANEKIKNLYKNNQPNKPQAKKDTEEKKPDPKEKLIY